MEHLRYVEDGKEKAGSYKGLAAVLGIPQTTMSDIKNGRRKLTQSQILKLAAFLGNVTAGEIWEAQCASDTEDLEERQLALNFLSQSRQLRHAAGMAAIACVTVFCVTYSAESLATLDKAGTPIFIMSTLVIIITAVTRAAASRFWSRKS